jgi:hypothetical protein
MTMEAFKEDLDTKSPMGFLEDYSILNIVYVNNTFFAASRMLLRRG